MKYCISILIIHIFINSAFSQNNEPFLDSIRLDSVNIYSKQIIYNQFKEIGFEIKSQKFTINPEIRNLIKGIKGSVITIEPNSFVSQDNVLITDELEIVLTEYFSTSDMILSNLQTLSNNQPLESAGMLKIEAYYNDNPLKLAINSKFNLKIPANSKLKDLQIFYGDQDDSPLTNWKLEKKDTIVYEDIKITKSKSKRRFSPHILYKNPDYHSLKTKKTKKLSFFKHKEVLEEVSLPYYVANITKLGLINFDKYIDSTGASINLLVKFNIKGVTSYIVFNEGKTILIDHCFNNNNEIERKLPSFIKKNSATIIAIKYNSSKQKTYFGYKELGFLNENSEIKIDLQESDNEVVIEQLNKLNVASQDFTKN